MSEYSICNNMSVKFIALVATLFIFCEIVHKTEAQEQQKWQAVFMPNNITLHMDESSAVAVDINNLNIPVNYKLTFLSEDAHIANVQQDINITDISNGNWHGNVTIKGLFLGVTKIRIQLETNTSKELSNEALDVIVIRQKRLIDNIFTGSVALLVSLLYINFGAALDLNVLRSILLRPIAPAIGIVLQFIGMPLLSYGLGLLIFPGMVAFQLGLFFTGVSPSGGASNIWAAILGGNISLSVLMTALSNLGAFCTMPFWLFTLGATIFNRANLTVPYTNIASYAVALIVPVAIGVLIQLKLPRVTRILVRLLKPISSCLIIFIVVFAIVTNLYLFQLFSWQIIVAGLALPWGGYIIAWILAKVLKQNPVDALTIAIETGIQNTGIAIFLLRFSLPAPQSDLTTVIPVSVAIMTPFPLLALYIYKRFISKELGAASEIEHERITEKIEPVHHSEE